MLQMMTRFLFVETCECEKCLRWFIKKFTWTKKFGKGKQKWGMETKMGKGLFLHQDVRPRT